MERRTRVTAFLVSAALTVIAPLGAQTGTLFVEGNKVGIGTDTPQQTLHVAGNAGDTRITVQETSSASGGRVLLSLQNNGSGAAQIRISSGTSEPWNFQTQASGFAFSRTGSGGSELFVGNDGAIRMGPGGTQRLLLEPDGDLIIAGSLTESSSRAAKENFLELDPRATLQAVAGLPVLAWQYKDDHEHALHIGPMADDFHAAFGTGADAESIAPGDKAGVALLAIQGLQELMGEKDRQIDELRSRVAELEKLVATLANGAADR